MHYLAILPALCAMIALILSNLCLFAGSNHDMLENYDLILVNTSRIAVDLFNTSSSSSSGDGSGDGLTGIFHDIGNEIHNLTAATQNEIEESLNNALDSFAQVIGVSDFYSVHILNHCEGNFSPNGTSKRNVTYCSTSRTSNLPNGFNITDTMQKQLASAGLDINLNDLHWPQTVSDAVDGMRLAFRAGFVLYFMAITTTAFAFVSYIVGIFMFHSALFALLQVFFGNTAFFFLMLASAIVTGAATKATALINKYGADIDVNAARGDKLIATTWAATMLMVIASCVWLWEWWIRRKRESMTVKEGKVMG